MAAITIRNLNMSYGAVRVLHGINLHVPDNSFVVFVGPSGCGKSSLLRTIAGLEDKESGEILLDGRDISGEAPVDRDVAMVFQSYALYPQMTVAENIAFPLSLAKMDRADIAARIKHVSDLLRLEPYLDRKPAHLSGGQRQRVAIGRAIVREPKVFLFDEPLSNLDAELRVEMRLQIGQLRRRLAATFVYVTHDQVEAMTLADTIVVLRDGLIEQVGAPLELYHRPANQFVAGFIGSPKMNFVPGGVAGQPGAATVGVRPEHLLIDSAGPLKGIVRTVENLGSVSFAYVSLPDETLLTVQLRPEHQVGVDQPVAMAIAPGHAHRFDKEGRALTH